MTINYSDVAWISVEHRKCQRLITTWRQIPGDYDLIIWHFLAWIGEDDCLKASFNNASIIVILAAVKSQFWQKEKKSYSACKDLYQPVWYYDYDWIQPLIKFFHEPRMVDFCHVKPWYIWYILLHCFLSAGDSYAMPRLTNTVLFGRRTDHC